MRYFKPSSRPGVKTVVYKEHPELTNMNYQEFVPSYWSWILPQEQVERAEHLNDITKPK